MLSFCFLEVAYFKPCTVAKESYTNERNLKSEILKILPMKQIPLPELTSTPISLSTFSMQLTAFLHFPRIMSSSICPP